MKKPRIIKMFSYMYELNKRNLKVYRVPRRIPKAAPILENSIHWVGHATTVINMYGKVFLTDPVLGNLGHLKRIVDPSIDLTNINLDYILISHGHMDHLNYRALNKLNKKAVIIVPRGIKSMLRLLGFKNVHTLSAGEVYKDKAITIRAIEANHIGRRYPGFGFGNSNSYIVQHRDKKVLFAGDTAFTDIYKGITVDAAIMPVGCYKPDEFTKMHCTPVQSYEMFKMMNSGIMIPIHYKTYILAQDEDRETENTLNNINDGTIKIIDIGGTVKI
ncbi:MBL fold metallo-hydrolase [Clostridium pasteurianum]|uniref:Putative Zn-dependent hydrolase of beta-lactamase fold protein n=1 Tax=Clostridium pasteurianum BC1 TaxID=86416 RepID=R4KEU1_CLOPA|nr:MBL fold metallo-hydrolase [Clostridium pasteurianum]AGK98130.1 putative Zn-dependent hydrolase of beta-lactamase fold protein [Clostridium pasteurianum BC1]